MNTFSIRTKLALAVVAALGITACNDSGDGTPAAKDTVSVATPVAKTTSGVITGFGSVFINGVEYETTGSSFVVDGVEGDESLLKLGMVVTLTGTDDANGTGEAVKVEFEDEVEGVVLANNVLTDGTLNIMGLTIHTNEDTIFESTDPNMLSLDMIAEGNIVEVSGYSAGDGSVWATRLEVKKVAHTEGEKIESKGIISSLTATTFMLGDLLVDYSMAALDDNLSDGLSDGMLVKVDSISGINDAGALVASEIELKSATGKKSHKYTANDDEVELEGVITAVISTTSLEINGAPVVLDANTQYVHGDAATAMVGLKVKAKGSIDANGNMVAEKLVYKPTGDLKLEGQITAIDLALNTFTVFGKEISIDGYTMVKDDKDDVKYKFGVDDLVIGDWIKIKAYFNADAGLTAMKMEREVAEADSMAKLEGKIDAIDPATYQLMIAGITVDYSSKPDLANVVGDKLELKGEFINGIFVASKLEAGEADEHYIGGEDAHEDESKDSRDDESDDNGMKDEDAHEEEGTETETETESDDELNDTNGM